jgi:Tfp pilus assembly protein PilN
MFGHDNGGTHYVMLSARRRSINHARQAPIALRALATLHVPTLAIASARQNDMIWRSQSAGTSQSSRAQAILYAVRVPRIDGQGTAEQPASCWTER